MSYGDYDYGDWHPSAFWRLLLLILVMALPIVVAGLVAEGGIKSTLLWLSLSAIAVAAIVVMILKVRARVSKGAKAIKLFIASVYVLLLVGVVLPAFSALEIRAHDDFASAVYVIYLVITLVVWILLDTQILDDRVAAWREKPPRPRTRGARLPAPGVAGNSSAEQATAHDSDVGESEEIDDE